MKKALIVIDYTYDFVADDGKLTCGKPGQAIENNISTLIEQFIEQNDVVVFANDLHVENDPYHPESKLFPAHNIVGTKGRELYGSVKELYETYKDRVISFDKTRYSAFAGTNLDILLRERNVEEVILVGVCTDICILHTAVDSYNLGYKITIPEHAVASFNEIGHKWALGHFKSCLGASII
ncbi:cysteine hydrolase family protein [Solibacillus isronensis]|uniref:cysteine hydrolase family protein n=1 Tax=Solibacillus isronensis TaxID=412383 RepID=UPI0020425681|nr:isochorismatase family cysteine hydrolase [Solibacillus isronensis]MCM3721292.1 cysteine hydrolase [Solibacillus isronensis]